MSYKHHIITTCWFCTLPLAFACSGAEANKCDAPPYGDAVQNYKAMYSAFAQASAAQPGLPPNALTGMLQAALTEACNAKFNHGSRATYYRAGLSDSYINDASTTALANAWFNLRNQALAKETAPPREADGSRIYAAFLCLRATNTCNRQGAIFNTLADCQRYARTITVRSPDASGRFLMSNDQWLECRSRHVAAWEPEP